MKWQFTTKDRQTIIRDLTQAELIELANRGHPEAVKEVLVAPFEDRIKELEARIKALEDKAKLTS